jgi:hypothetical protein
MIKLPKELTTVTPLSKYLAMVVFISLPFVGFFLGMRYQEMMDLSKRQQEKSSLVIPRTPILSPAEALAKEGNSIANPTVDPSITANWKTYRNDEFGFELKYPLYFEKFNEYYNKTLSARSKNGEIFFSVHVITNQPSLEDYLGKLDNSRTAEHPEIDPVTILKKSNERVGSFRAVQYEIAQYAAPSFSIETYLEVPPDRIISLRLARIDKNLTESDRQLYDQILSTFRFVK